MHNFKAFQPNCKTLPAETKLILLPSTLPSTTEPIAVSRKLPQFRTLMLARHKFSIGHT